MLEIRNVSHVYIQDTEQKNIINIKINLLYNSSLLTADIWTSTSHKGAERPWYWLYLKHCANCDCKSFPSSSIVAVGQYSVLSTSCQKGKEREKAWRTSKESFFFFSLLSIHKVLFSQQQEKTQKKIRVHGLTITGLTVRCKAVS